MGDLAKCEHRIMEVKKAALAASGLLLQEEQKAQIDEIGKSCMGALEKHVTHDLVISEKLLDMLETMKPWMVVSFNQELAKSMAGVALKKAMKKFEEQYVGVEMMLENDPGRKKLACIMVEMAKVEKMCSDWPKNRTWLKTFQKDAKCLVQAAGDHLETTTLTSSAKALEALHSCKGGMTGGLSWKDGLQPQADWQEFLEHFGKDLGQDE